MSMGGGGGGSAPNYDALAQTQKEIYYDVKEEATPFTEAGRDRALPVILHELGLGPRPYLTNDGNVVYENADGSVYGGQTQQVATESPYASQIADMEGWRNETGGGYGESEGWSWWHSGYDRPYSDEEYQNKLGRLREMDSMWSSLRGSGGQAGGAFGGALGSLPDGATALGGYTKTPGYDFRLQEGNRSILSGMNAAGAGKDSGATYKALGRFGQDYATNEYNNYLSRLGAVAGYGQFGVSTTAGAAQNYSNQLTNIAGMQQSAYDNAQVRQANSLGGLGNFIGTLGSAAISGGVFS
jgi:hypothetical protein